MNIVDIKAVNDLFKPIYPYIARQITETYGRQDGKALEIGPFAPGISIEVARLCPMIEIGLGDDSAEVNEYFQAVIAEAGLDERIRVQEIDKFNLPFPDNTFNLVYFRGGLFFWGREDLLLREIYRVLSPRGLAMVGGGFGAETPDALVASIVDESRELNRRLGKRGIPEAGVAAMVEKAGLEGFTLMDCRRGLWAVIRKP